MLTPMPDSLPETNGQRGETVGDFAVTQRDIDKVRKGSKARPAASDRVDAMEMAASAFHESYERQAPSHGYETREASAVPWADVPLNNRELMMGVIRDLVQRGIIYLAAAPLEQELQELANDYGIRLPGATVEHHVQLPDGDLT